MILYHSLALPSSDKITAKLQHKNRTTSPSTLDGLGTTQAQDTATTDFYLATVDRWAKSKAALGSGRPFGCEAMLGQEPVGETFWSGGFRRNLAISGTISNRQPLKLMAMGC